MGTFNWYLGNLGVFWKYCFAVWYFVSSKDTIRCIPQDLVDQDLRRNMASLGHTEIMATFACTSEAMHFYLAFQLIRDCHITSIMGITCRRLMSCRGHVLDVNVTHNWFQQSHLRGTLPQLFNTLRPRQKGRHFADDIVKCIFLNENVWISINISLRFVPRGPIDNIPALVQIMAWRRPGDKPLSEPMMASLMTHIYIYMRHSASMS